MKSIAAVCRDIFQELLGEVRKRPNTGMNPTRSAIAPRAGYADRSAARVEAWQYRIIVFLWLKPETGDY